MNKVTKKNAHKVLSMIITKYFRKGNGDYISDDIDFVSYTETGTEIVRLANGQVYKFTITLK